MCVVSVCEEVEVREGMRVCCVVWSGCSMVFCLVSELKCVRVIECVMGC